MSKFIYFLFLLPISQSAAMDTSHAPAASRDAMPKTIIVANILNRGVMAQVWSTGDVESQKQERKVWIPKGGRGEISVSPPPEQSLVHVLHIKTTEEVVLGMISFMHPLRDAVYCLLPGEGENVKIEEVPVHELASLHIHAKKVE